MATSAETSAQIPSTMATSAETSATIPSTESPLLQQQHEPAAKDKTLLLVFNWKQCTATLTLENATEPSYTAAFKTFSKPTLRFKAADGSQFGTGHAHLISINADCTFNDKPIKLEALSRLKTAYTYQSQVFRNKNDEPARMTWQTQTDYHKTWTFICLDETRQAVAKLDYNVWGVKKIGRIEFVEDREVSEEFRREMVVVSVTLVYTMLVRANNIFNLIGSATHRKPKLEDEKLGQAADHDAA